uniref:Thioredoxin family protein n=1 Tax=candidate division WOR-3 bacterium TaxID=2052148 RepID=A0A7C4YF99_UNCW3
MKNYVPSSVENDYKIAIYREFKKYLGENIEEEKTEGLSIKILGQSCPNCDRLYMETMGVLQELNISADIEHIQDLKEISKYGMIATPGLVINGKVYSMGRIPSKEKIKEWILNNWKEQKSQ